MAKVTAPPPVKPPHLRKRKDESSGNWRLVACAITLVGIAALVNQFFGSGSRKTKVKKEAPPNPLMEAAKSRLFTDEGEPAFWRGGSGASTFHNDTYWEERYKKDAKQGRMYDWYGTWFGDGEISIKSKVAPYIPSTGLSSAILNIGCGNSRIVEELVQDGYKNLTNVDLSSVVIEEMTKKFADKDGVIFKRMDITKMEFPTESFDVIFDKGTLDAIYTGDASAVKTAVVEINRVLRTGGIFVSVTFGKPNSRKELNTTTWSRVVTQGLARVEATTKDNDAYQVYVHVK